MMLRIPAVVLLLLIPGPLLHAGEPLFTPSGADRAGMAFASVAYPGHWGSFHNQALMVSQNYFSTGFVVEAPFMMTDLARETLSFIIPGRPAPFGFTLSHSGNAQYSVFFAGLGSAIAISDGLSVGLQADFLRQNGIGDYADENAITFEAGIAIKINPQLMLGVHVINPLPGLNSLPSSLRAGICWRPYSGITIAFETSKVTKEPLAFHTGLEWALKDKLAFRAGYMSSPSCLTFGTGFSSGSLQADLGFIVNERTGVTPSLSLILAIKPR